VISVNPSDENENDDAGVFTNSLDEEQDAGASNANQEFGSVNSCQAALTVSRATLCRKGPSSAYAVIGDLQPGEESQILGLYAQGGWYVIDNYGVGGSCWLFDGYATVSGDTSCLSYWTPPDQPDSSAGVEAGGDAGAVQGEGSGSNTTSEETSELEEANDADTITFTFNNLLENAFVSQLFIKPVSSSNWRENLISSNICENSSRQVTIPNQGSEYDIRAEVITGGCGAVEIGSVQDYFEYGVILSTGANYPFKPY
jgi:hypothetical protein